MNILTLQEIVDVQHAFMEVGRTDDPQYEKLGERAQELRRRWEAGLKSGRAIWERPDPEIHRHLAEQIAVASPQSIDDLK